eukprot:5014228-Pleurochrysis_carterae.AAC.2
MGLRELGGVRRGSCFSGWDKGLEAMQRMQVKRKRGQGAGSCALQKGRRGSRRGKGRHMILVVSIIDETFAREVGECVRSRERKCKCVKVNAGAGARVYSCARARMRVHTHLESCVQGGRHRELAENVLHRLLDDVGENVQPAAVRLTTRGGRKRARAVRAGWGGRASALARHSTWACLNPCVCEFACICMCVCACACVCACRARVWAYVGKRKRVLEADTYSHVQDWMWRKECGRRKTEWSLRIWMQDCVFAWLHVRVLAQVRAPARVRERMPCRACACVRARACTCVFVRAFVP